MDTVIQSVCLAIAFWIEEENSLCEDDFCGENLPECLLDDAAWVKGTKVEYENLFPA